MCWRSGWCSGSLTGSLFYLRQVDGIAATRLMAIDRDVETAALIRPCSLEMYRNPASR